MIKVYKEFSNRIFIAAEYYLRLRSSLSLLFLKEDIYQELIIEYFSLFYDIFMHICMLF